MPYREIFQQLSAHVRQTALLESTCSTLGWDERTYLPPEAGEYRAEQITFLTGLIHHRHTDPQVGHWLEVLLESELMQEPHDREATTIRMLHRSYEKQIKLSQELVEEIARATVLGQQAWVEARKDDDFASFLPKLENIIFLRREQAEALGYEDTPYDALLDEYEPGEKTGTVERVLTALREELSPFVAEIQESKKKAEADLLTRRYPREAQEAFGRKAARAIGFDFNRGRLDVTHHPFCTGLGPSDCRITTRYDEHHFPGAFFGTLHESGHGIYEQGLEQTWYGLPPGQSVSLGIHESQSRMWENFVGRGLPFWKHFFPKAQEAFPEALSDVSLERFFFAVNDVRPSLIRVEADEATYNLHIIIRFELEQALLSGDLKAADAPAAWNEKYQHYLGIQPPSNANGVLQDVHWSAGLIGYFPTYSLGNLYAAQLFEQADSDLGGLGQQFEIGEFKPLKNWLTQNIHKRGQCYTAAELVKTITGAELSHEPLMRHLRGKLAPLYELD